MSLSDHTALPPTDTERQLWDAQARVEVLERTLVKAAIPLEVLHGLEVRSWYTPRLRKWWRRLVTPKLRNEIMEAVMEIRAAIEHDRI